MRPIQSQRETFAFRMASALDDYRWERQRQIDEREKTTGGHATEEADWKLRNAPIITYKDFLKSRKKGPAQQAEEEAASKAPVSHEVYTPDPSWGADEKPPW